MGMIDRALRMLFGGGGNVIRDTVEVFRENAEGAAGRQAERSKAALAQFAAEFAVQKCGRFDRFMDGLNRLPRPALAMGTLGLFVAAMVDPVWFASRMAGLALVPEPLWWLLGAIVSFYFGARHQAKGQEFSRSIAGSLANAPDVARALDALNPQQETRNAPSAPPPSGFDHGPRTTNATAAPGPTGNAALDDWRTIHG
jgi:hypothetical protein